MTYREQAGGYVARASGSVGHEILSPDGVVVAWTVDEPWAAIIVELVDGAEERDLVLSAARRGDAALTNGENRYHLRPAEAVQSRPKGLWDR